MQERAATTSRGVTFLFGIGGLAYVPMLSFGGANNLYMFITLLCTPCRLEAMTLNKSFAPASVIYMAVIPDMSTVNLPETVFDILKR